LKTTYLGHWLAVLGQPQAPLIKHLGIAHSTIPMAIAQGTRPRWTADLADYLGLPSAEVLLDMSPNSPEAREYRARAIVRAARRRLVEFEQAHAKRERNGTTLNWWQRRKRSEAAARAALSCDAAD